MNILYDNKRNKTIVFFPKSYRFFKVNNNIENILIEINQGNTVKDVAQKYSVTEDECYKLLELIKKEEELVLEDTTDLILETFENKLEKLVISITDLCNLRCRYCYEEKEGMNIRKNTITEEVIDKLFGALLKQYTVIKHIQIFGGEPLLYPDLVSYICEKTKEAYKSGKLKEMPNIGLVSNGTLVTEEVINIVKSYDIGITISFDGEPFVNDEVRVYADGKGTSVDILQNIKKMQNSGIEKISIETTYNRRHSANNVTITDILNYVSKKVGVRNVHVAPISCSNSDPLYYECKEEFLESINAIFKGEAVIIPDLVRRILMALTQKRHMQFLCGAGVGQYSIAPNGDIYPCFMFFGNCDYIIGNVCNQDVFASIKTNKVAEKFCNYKKTDNTKCASCHLIDICSNCAGANKIITGDPFISSESICELNKSLFKEIIFNLLEKYEKKNVIK